MNFLRLTASNGNKAVSLFEPARSDAVPSRRLCTNNPEHLIGWNILYHLARLEPTLFDRLLEEGTIRPAMTLREAKELLARFQGGQGARSRKTKIKEYLRRLAQFIASRRDWQTAEREQVIEALTRHVEEIAAASDPVLDRNRSSRNFIAQRGLSTAQPNTL